MDAKPRNRRTTTRSMSRRQAITWLGLGGVTLGLAACSPTPPRTEPKPAATTAPAKPAEAAKPAAQPTAAPVAAAKPTDVPKPAAQPTTAPATVKKGGTLVIGAD